MIPPRNDARKTLTGKIILTSIKSSDLNGLMIVRKYSIIRKERMSSLKINHNLFLNGNLFTSKIKNNKKRIDVKQSSNKNTNSLLIHLVSLIKKYAT
jgi:hypothetical protein